MNAERIAELKALCEKATPGPWEPGTACNRTFTESTPTLHLKGADAMLAALLRTALPECLEYIQALESELLKLRPFKSATGASIIYGEIDSLLSEIESLNGIIADNRAQFGRDEDAEAGLRSENERLELEKQEIIDARADAESSMMAEIERLRKAIELAMDALGETTAEMHCPECYPHFKQSETPKTCGYHAAKAALK